MLGGKWTVYRAMAEDAINAVELSINGQTTRCRTRDYPLFGSADRSEEFSHELAESYSVSAETATHLMGFFAIYVRRRNLSNLLL